MLAKSLLLALSAVTAVLAGTPVEGGDWTSTSPGFGEQECSGGKVNGLTFTLPKNPSGGGGSGCNNGHARAERRYRNDYSSGVRQFGGQFKINSMSGSRISIKQTFNGSTGPYLILAVDKGGRLYAVHGGKTIADGVANVGSTVRINTVHDVKKRRYSVYVNGKEMFRDNNAPGGSFYDKFGAYLTDSGKGDISITWSDVQFWTKS